MLSFKRERKAGGLRVSFEEFLQEEWPDDYAVYIRAQRGDPACLRSYEGWRLKFEFIGL
jgi:hypothetical protein